MSQCGVNEGFEAWRQFVIEWEPKLRTRFVGLLMNVLGYRLRDDMPTKLAAFERTVHDYHLSQNNYSFDASQAYCFGNNLKL